MSFQQSLRKAFLFQSLIVRKLLMPRHFRKKSIPNQSKNLPLEEHSMILKHSEKDRVSDMFRFDIKIYIYIIFNSYYFINLSSLSIEREKERRSISNDENRIIVQRCCESDLSQSKVQSDFKLVCRISYAISVTYKQVENMYTAWLCCRGIFTQGRLTSRQRKREIHRESSTEVRSAEGTRRLISDSYTAVLRRIISDA